ncbi:MAG: AMIN domain-containing protein, partial [Alphaproteobacteria bacterium]|nr:AMIN domain-containing protein [Alphaproteobacteria bacterium]
MKLFRYLATTILTILFCVVSLSATASTLIKDMRLGNQADGARVVLDMNKSVNYRVFLLNDPKRAVVDLDDADINSLQTKFTNQVVNKTRIGKMSGNDKRIVMELSRAATVKKAFLIPPQSGQKRRLVIDPSKFVKIVMCVAIVLSVL